MICLYSKLFEANFSSFVPLYKITERKVFFTKEKTNNFGRFSSILANNFRKKKLTYRTRHLGKTF